MTLDELKVAALQQASVDARSVVGGAPSLYWPPPEPAVVVARAKVYLEFLVEKRAPSKKKRS
jgi:hypothetical protein